MEQPEGYCSFTRRVRRGVILFSILGFASAGFAAWALATSGFRPWAAAGFLAALLFGLARNHVRGRYITAWKVSENPQIVYWAHPTRPFEPLSNDPIEECKLLTLHLRDGTELEVGLPPSEMRKFIAWLSEQNPSVRWGAYDKPETAKTEPMCRPVVPNMPPLQQNQSGGRGVALIVTNFFLIIALAVGGTAVGAHGVDQFQAGIRQMWTGEHLESLTSGAIQSAGMSPRAANLTDAGISVVGSLGAGFATTGIRVTELSATSISSEVANASLLTKIGYYEVGQLSQSGNAYGYYSPSH